MVEGWFSPCGQCNDFGSRVSNGDIARGRNSWRIMFEVGTLYGALAWLGIFWPPIVHNSTWDPEVKEPRE